MKKYVMLFLIIFVGSAFAENTITLPQGRIRARLKLIYASKITEKYNRDKSEESLVTQFERELDMDLASKLNPQLGGAMMMFGVPTLGTFNPDMELSTLVVGTALEYGVTDNLTLGVIAPIITANSRFNLAFEKSAAAQHPAFSNIDFVKAANDAAVEKGYHQLGDWNSTGLGDVELGAKYRFYNTKNWALATKAGFRLPTGRVDDPNHLTDIAFGDGQTDVGATLLVDYQGLPDLLVNALVKYTWQLADQQTMRVTLGDEIFASSVEELSRNLGDSFETSLYAEYTFLKYFNINAASNYRTKKGDTYQSSSGSDTAPLELNTYQMDVIGDVGIGFSTLPWVKEGTFALPMDVGINAQIPLVGQNTTKVSSVNLEYKLYF